MIKIAYNELYCHPVPENHRFPMEKYELIPQQLIRKGIFGTNNFFSPQKASLDQVNLAHDSAYLNDLIGLKLDRKAQRKTGFPLSKQLVEREFVITGGTIECVQHALQYGVSLNVAGGTHHAYHSHGEGFCLFNDIVVSSFYALQEKWLKKVLVVDLDVHQGNGTAKLCQNREDIFTFSMHGAKNYPMYKEQSDMDIPLEDGTRGEEYLQILYDTLPRLIEQEKPDLIHYQCGVDPHESDKLGRLSLSMDDLFERDKFVLETCKTNAIPVVCTMGGGYSPDIKVILDAHCQTFELANEIFT